MIPRALAKVLAWVGDLRVLMSPGAKPLSFNCESRTLACFFCLCAVYKVFKQVVNNIRKEGSLNMNSVTVRKCLTAFFIPAQYIGVKGAKWNTDGKIHAAASKNRCLFLALNTEYLNGIAIAIHRSMDSAHRLVIDKLRNSHRKASWFFLSHLLLSQHSGERFFVVLPRDLLSK